MKRSKALATLKRQSAWDQDPALSAPELDSILDDNTMPDAAGNGAEWLEEWEPATVYEVGDVVVPNTVNGHAYVCTVGGTSGATSPAFPLTTGATVTDGGVTWQEDGESSWTPTYNLAAASAEAWRTKAGKAANRITIISAGDVLTRGQFIDHCSAMEAKYLSGVTYSVGVSNAPR